MPTFDPTKQANQYKVRIIEDIINKNKDTTGVLYLDGVIIPGKEKYNEIMRRKSKVEKALSVRIDGDPDYLAIFNKFTTNDREKLALLADFYRMRYPHKDEFAPKRVKDDKSLIRFDNVNILDADGNFLFEKDYSAEYSDSYSPNETELVIFNNIFKRHSLVRGGVFLKGKNINRNRLLHHFDLLKVKKFFSSSDLNEIRRSLLSVGCPYKMDRKSKMLVHWPTFDKDGKEVILSSVDSDVWFKVSRAVVKAANDMNFDIYRGVAAIGIILEELSGSPGNRACRQARYIAVKGSVLEVCDSSRRRTCRAIDGVRHTRDYDVLHSCARIDLESGPDAIIGIRRREAGVHDRAVSQGGGATYADQRDGHPL